MNPHFVEILKAFRDQAVEYLLIGAYALAAHGHVRATLDIDLWVKPTPDNACRTWRALQRFRAPLSKMNAADFSEPDVLYQIGLAPSRIDIMTSVTGLEFEWLPTSKNYQSSSTVTAWWLSAATVASFA